MSGKNRSTSDIASGSLNDSNVSICDSRRTVKSRNRYRSTIGLFAHSALAMSTAFTALLALITGLVGAVFGHLLAERKSRRDELSKMRLDAYSDFIRAISYLSAARRSGHTQDELKELAMLNDAKVRICICSDSPVVEAMERFWLQGGTLEREQEILAFTHLCRTMRASLGNKHLGLNILLSNVMFKLEPSTYSFRGAREID